MISLREADSAELEWEEDCKKEMAATRSNVSRTIVVEATEEYVAEDCYEVCVVKMTTIHCNAVGDGTRGTCGDGRQSGTGR